MFRLSYVGARFEDNTVVFFFKEDKYVLPNHNRPLHATALVRYVELRRALIDPGYPLNITPLLILNAMGTPQLVEQPIEVSGLKAVWHSF